MGFSNFNKNKKVNTSDSTVTGMIGDVLKDAILKFQANPGTESIQGICDSLIIALSQKDYAIVVPVDREDLMQGKNTFLMLDNGQVGEAYRAYTGTNGLGYDDGCITTVISALTFFEYVAHNTASGIVFDYGCGNNTFFVLSRENIFKILFFAQYIRKYQTKSDDEAFDKKFVFAEKGLMYHNVDSAIEKYLDDSSDESHINLCQQLVYAFLYNISYRIAVDGCFEFLNYQIYKVYHHEQVGPVYMVFTSMESAGCREGWKSCFQDIRTIFNRVIDYDVNGILLDGQIFLNKENIVNIVKNGYMQLELQPPERKKFMIEEM